MGKWLICIRVYYEILGFCLGSGSLGDILFPSQSESHEGKYSYYKCTGSKLHNYRVSVRTWLYLLCSWCNLSSSGHRFDKKVPHPNTNGAGLDRSLVSKNTKKSSQCLGQLKNKWLHLLFCWYNRHQQLEVLLERCLIPLGDAPHSFNSSLFICIYRNWSITTMQSQCCYKSNTTAIDIWDFKAAQIPISHHLYIISGLDHL